MPVNSDELQRSGLIKKSIELANLEKDASKYISDSISESTKFSYRSDWHSFVQWCDEMDLSPIPASSQTISLWITKLSNIGYSVSTISRRLTSISQAHETAMLDNPVLSSEVKKTFKGIKRKFGTAQKKAKPLLISDLIRITENTRPTFQGRRDLAILWIGWSAALRRSEIVSIDRNDVEFVKDGLILNITKSKTDQEKKGYKIGIPFGSDKNLCPVILVRQWIELAEIKEGPMFFSIGSKGDEFYFKHVENRRRLSSRSINNIIKKRVRQSGISSDRFSGHSLRSGFITTCAKHNIPSYQIQKITRHSSEKTMSEYIIFGNLFSENPLSILI